MGFTSAQPNDSATIPISAPYNPDGNTFPALASEPGAYVDASSNQSSAALMSFLRSRTVQSASNKSSGSVASLAKAFTNNNVAGNSIIVCCGVGNGTAPTVSDSNGNTYTQIGQVANGTAFNVAIFLGTGATLGTGIASGANTVTVNNGGSTASIAMEIYEIFGVLAIPSAQPDQKITNTGTSGTASTSAIAASFPNEIAFAAVGVGTAAQTITPGSGWNNDSGQQNPTTPAGLFSFVSMSQFLGSQSPVTPQATFTSEPWAIVVATFKTVVVPVAGTMELFSIASGLSQANRVPVSPAGQQGTLTISGTLTANSDNSLTFSGNSTVARLIRIQNESGTTIYWNTDATASSGSPSLPTPGTNAVVVEWINVACTTLHIFIPSGGTTTLNGSGGVKVTAWA